jgi:scyllo-inositol 2-dehydrogenase (NADP+)
MTILVIGGGKMGMSHLALATQYLGKSNVALCDTKLSTRILFRLFGYKTFANVDAAAASLDRLEGVLIATPTPSHASLAKWAINKGVPCFVEKPLTLNLEASNELKVLAAAKSVPVQVGFVLRYVASFQRLRNLVQGGQLGRMLGYRASMRGNVMLKPPAVDSWQGDFKRGGGCLNEYGPHIIDLCQFIFGPVDRVDDVHMTQVFCAHADDRIDFGWVHRTGSLGKVAIDWCDITKRKSVLEFQVKFEHAEVRVDNSAFEITWNEESAVTEDKRLEIDTPIRPSNVAYYLRGEEFSLELEEFLGTCVGRRFGVDDTIPKDTTARLKDGCEVDRIIDEIARKVGLK